MTILKNWTSIVNKSNIHQTVRDIKHTHQPSIHCILEIQVLQLVLLTLAGPTTCTLHAHHAVIEWEGRRSADRRGDHGTHGKIGICRTILGVRNVKIIVSNFFATLMTVSKGMWK